MKTENIVIIHPETTEQEDALKAFAKALKMKFELAKEKPYDADFIDKIKESRQQAREGKTARIELDNIWKE